MKLGQGNIFRSVCQEFCPQGPCACQRGVCGRGMHGRGHALQGVCGGGRVKISVHGGHACQRDVRGRGACVAGGHAWQGGVHGGEGTCVAYGQ